MSTKKIELLQPHEHAGREYPAGCELTLPVDAADWLIALKVAKPAGASSGSTRVVNPVDAQMVTDSPGKSLPTQTDPTKETA